MVKSFVGRDALFPLFCCQCMRHKSCPQFSFCQIIRQTWVNNGFQYPIHFAIILQLARWLSFKTAAAQTIFSFVFVVPVSPNAFTNISHIFDVINSASQQNFIVARYSKLNIRYCKTLLYRRI